MVSTAPDIVSAVSAFVAGKLDVNAARRTRKVVVIALGVGRAHRVCSMTLA